jgi:phosphoribosylformylglycinamidine synthase
MKARIYVTLKPTVLDPQGQTIARALRSLGHGEVVDVRQGKVFEVEVEGLTAEEAKARLESVSHEVLANPVTEQFRVWIEE